MDEATKARTRGALIAGLFLIAVGVIAFGGCGIIPKPAPGVPMPKIFPTHPTQQELVVAINRNTSAAGLMQSNVSVSLDGMPGRLSGSMVVHSPKKVRLKVSLAGLPGSGVDIGSNDQEFWIWNKSSIGGQEAAIYFARHHEYAGSQIHQQLQIEPGWVIDALGLINIDQNVQVEGPYPRSDGYLELRLIEPGGAGAITRVLTIEPTTAAIVQQAVYDANNQRTVWAKSSGHHHLQELGANLPRFLEIHATDAQGQEMVLTVTIKNYGAFYGDAIQIWQKPMPADVPAYDLSRAQLGYHQPRVPYPSQGVRSADAVTPPTKPLLKGFDLLKR